MRMKWNNQSIAAYKASGEVIRAIGGKPMREVADKDSNSVLTFWATPKGLVITQTFVDTGDVVYLKDVSESYFTNGMAEVLA